MCNCVIEIFALSYEKKKYSRITVNRFTPRIPLKQLQNPFYFLQAQNFQVFSFWCQNLKNDFLFSWYSFQYSWLVCVNYSFMTVHIQLIILKLILAAFWKIYFISIGNGRFVRFLKLTVGCALPSNRCFGEKFRVIIYYFKLKFKLKHLSF